VNLFLCCSIINRCPLVSCQPVLLSIGLHHTYWYLLVLVRDGDTWSGHILQSTSFLAVCSFQTSTLSLETWMDSSCLARCKLLLLVDCFHFTWPLDCLDAKPRWNGSARNYQSCCWKCQFQSSWGSFSAFLVKPCSEIHDSRVVLNRALAWVFNIFCGWEQPFAL